jgi:hypothetical protein
MKKILGKCQCGELVTKWTNHENSPRADKTAYKPTNDEKSKWFIFRCRVCSALITESWTKT